MNTERSQTEVGAKPQGVATAEDWAAIIRSTPADYRGTTAFQKMSPFDRLRWLDEASEFVERQHQQRERRAKSGGRS